MSIAEKLLTIAENEQRVFDAGYEKGKQEGGGGDTEAAFEAGRQAESEAFWNSFTNNGNRTNYQYAFWYWGNEYITPTRAIVPTDKGSLYHTFAFNTNLKEIRKGKFDFSQKERGTNNQQGFGFTFQGCRNLLIIEDIGIKAEHQIIQAFSECSSLHTIEVLRIAEDTALNTNIFRNCANLQNITIDGTIGQNGFDIHWSTKLTKASILSILNACNIDVTSSPVTVTFPSKCIDGVTSTQELLSETGDPDLYSAQSTARNLGYNIAFA